MFRTNRISISGNSQQTVALDGAAGAQSAPLEGGTYDCWSDIAMFLKVGKIANDVTAETGYAVAIGEKASVYVPDGQCIGGFGATAGTLSFHKVD
jgi:hypothetical protein